MVLFLVESADMTAKCVRVISSQVFVIVLFFLGSFTDVNALFGFKRPDLLDPPDSVNLRTVSTKWFEQKVDHFTPIDTRTWKQRYHVNDAYYNDTTKNHIFLMIGGEAAANPRWVNYGAWLDTAAQHGGLLLYLEHRFYGESQPLSDLSTANLKYLSSHQALEDIASFIQGMNKEYNLATSDAKWIAFGGSYAGTLTAWLRQRYPHLVTGAMSSSAPLEAILDFSEYLKVVTDGMNTHSTACTTSIKSAYSQLEELVASCLEDFTIYAELDSSFRLCETIETSEENDQDIANLFEILTDNNFAYVVQYHGIPGITTTINDLCNILVNQTADTTELTRLAAVNNLLLNAREQTCTDYKYNTLVANWKNTTASSNLMMRQWVYQTCTEFGFFQTSSQQNSIFGSRFDISFFTGLCQDVFGSEFNETLTSLGIQATNNKYGAKSIEASNIVYVQGTVDPWHVLGKLESTSDDHTVIVIDGVAHCANMYPAQETDSAALTAARNQVNVLIGQWLEVTSTDDNNSSSTTTGSVIVFSSLLICLYQLF